MTLNWCQAISCSEVEILQKNLPGLYGDGFRPLSGINAVSEVSVARRYTSCIPVTILALDSSSSLPTRPKALQSTEYSRFLILYGKVAVRKHSFVGTFASLPTFQGYRSLFLLPHSRVEFADQFLIHPIVMFEWIAKFFFQRFDSI